MPRPFLYFFFFFSLVDGIVNVSYLICYYGDAVEWEKAIASRLRRATKRGKFSRAAWAFDIVLNSR